MDLVRAVQEEGDAQVTRLLVLANLSHVRIKEHLDEFVRKEWLAPTEGDGRATWRITPAGVAALHRLEQVEQGRQDSGLAL